MGQCISYICNLFTKNNQINTQNTVSKNTFGSKNYIPKFEKNEITLEIPKNTILQNKNDYMKIIQYTFNKNIKITEDKYINIREYLNDSKKYKYIITKNYIKYSSIVKQYKLSYNSIYINKNYDNIIICENENNLYTMPSSPYMSYTILYDPDYNLEKIKRKEFIKGLNYIINDLVNIVNNKRKKL